MGGLDGVTVLVVEDDDDVRAVIMRMLEAPRRTVLAAANANDALAHASSTEIDVLLSDVVLPGSSGDEIARLLRSMKPDLPVVYVSGWYDHPALPRPLREVVLQKAFTREQLISVLAAALDRESDG